MNEQAGSHHADESTSASAPGHTIGRALGRLPQGLFLLTAAFEHRQRGVLVTQVQQVCYDPPMIMFALNKSLQIGPFLHESRAFALNQIAGDDKMIPRRFTCDVTSKQDTFETLKLRRSKTGSPVLQRALAYFDCELVRHFDIEGDQDLYVGRVIDADVLNDGDPPVHFREDGLAH